MDQFWVLQQKRREFMNNKFKFLAITAAAFFIGFSVNNFAMSEVPCNCKIAVVDVMQVIESSSQVQAARKDHQAKAEEIIKYIEKARKDVAATTDEKKKKSLEEKYNKELNTKRKAMEKDYFTKLQDINKNINNTINEYAQNNNYKLVLAKEMVLYGGDDITEALKKSVK